MIPNYDVVIVGAGPIGITTACTLKAIHNPLNICVIDKREEPGRNHGLKINADAVDKIQALMSESACNPLAKVEDLQQMTKIFAGWSENFVRTSFIETELAKTATAMGICVLRGKEYGITPENFPVLCDNSEETQKHGVLSAIFKNARIIIGADGAHSSVRTVTMGGKKSHDETIRHILELKYQTLGCMEARSYKIATKDVVQHSNLAFETTSKDKNNPTKPVTYHVFINADTFKALRVEGSDGRLKGVFGNSWTLAELKELSGGDEKVLKVYEQINDYLVTLPPRQGKCEHEQISTLELNVYRSLQSTIKYKDKHILLVGDAESGLVLERGFNKGLQGAALCAKAVSNFFLKQLMAQPELSPSFAWYENETKALFEREMGYAKVKNEALRYVEGSLHSSDLAKVKFDKVSDSVSHGKLKISQKITEISAAESSSSLSSYDLFSCTLF